MGSHVKPRESKAKSGDQNPRLVFFSVPYGIVGHLSALHFSRLSHCSCFTEHSRPAYNVGSSSDFLDGDKPSADRWFARLNADLPATDVNSMAIRVSGEMTALGQSTDFDSIVDGSDHAVVSRYDALQANIEAVMDECRPADYQDLVR
jgi:hypothetical protein